MSAFAVMTSSVRQDWPTARRDFDWLDAEFHFTLDACASAENAKVDRYFTERDEGLMRSWQGERVFVNPPYGKQLPKWIGKCWNEAGHAEVVVALIPARVDTAAWHDYIFGHAEIRFLRGRMRFEGSGNDCPFPVAVVIWRNPLAALDTAPAGRVTSPPNEEPPDRELSAASQQREGGCRLWADRAEAGRVANTSPGRLGRRVK